MRELAKALSAVGLFLVLKIAVDALVFGIAQLGPTEVEELSPKLLGLSSFLSSLLILLVLYFWKPTQGAPDCWKRISFKLLCYLVGLGFLGVALNSFLLSFFLDAQQAMLEQSKMLLSTGYVGIFSVVVLIPIVEELVFRRVFLECLFKFTQPAVAIILSAVVFGLLHLVPVQILGATCLGLVFAWMYWKVRSILPSVLLHMLNNGFFMYSLSQMEEEQELLDSYWSIEHPYGWLVAGLTVLAFIAVFYRVEKLSKASNKSLQ